MSQTWECTFKESLIESITSSLSYSVLFDENLNDHLQEEQMDLKGHYWDPETVQAITWYLDSRFFCRPKASKSQEELHEGLKPLDEKAMTMLLMDGPNTNWAVLNKVKDFGHKNELLQIIDIGSCGLQVVHGAFKTGVKAFAWQLQKILGGLRIHQSYGMILLKLYSTINPSLNSIRPNIIHQTIIWWNIMLIHWFLSSFNSSRMLLTCYLHTFYNF